MIEKERVKLLNTKTIQNGGFVLYWMQASQRVEYNHALEYAVEKANELRQPLIVFFGITDNFPEGNERHYAFMLQGLVEVKEALNHKGIGMVILHQSPERGIVKMAREASLVIVDRGYLKIERAWRAYAASRLRCALVQVETDVVVPVEETSLKEEYSAATIRPKISKKLEAFLRPLRSKNPGVSSLSLIQESFQIDEVQKALSKLRIDRSAKEVRTFQGGTARAKELLQIFLEEKLDRYAELRNDPTADYHSHMSPYLHFGQISPLYIALKVLGTDSRGKEAFLEELITRRELAINFVWYNKEYDSIRSIPLWAGKTLAQHVRDKRFSLYSVEEMEASKTHDPYWNAAQTEMMVTGKMHGYMRMYWGKKILEWSRRPEEAFRTALYLNNKYELDGRDPNGFAGVAWCFGKHDRPWPERPIFGTIRYMNAEGLRRKFDADQYVRAVRLREPRI